MQAAQSRTGSMGTDEATNVWQAAGAHRYHHSGATGTKGIQRSTQLQSRPQKRSRFIPAAETQAPGLTIWAATGMVVQGAASMHSCRMRQLSC